MRVKKGNVNIEELVKCYKNGTDAEREIVLEKVLMDNEPLIKFLMCKHYPSYAKSNGEDMIQEANIAIIKHFPDFDPSKGKFSTFMGYYIMEAFKWYICELHGITSHYFTQIKKFNHAKAVLIDRGVKEITADILAEEMGCGLDAVLSVAGLADYMNSISIEGDERDKTLTGNGIGLDPEDCYAEQERKDALVSAIQRLNPFEQQVITLTYLAEDKELSLKEVSERLDTDVASVRRARNKALRQLGADNELTDIVGGVRDHELHEAADDILIEFSMPKAAIEKNLALAFNIDLEI